jgi:glycosyltransferase involved in cell wall biosynthesis
VTQSYPDVFVVIPALDEEASIGGVLDSIPDVKGIAVVDNGSTDRTAAVAREALAGRPHGFVVAEPRRGYGAACLAGIRAAVPVDPVVLVILDADDATDIADLGAIVEPVLSGEADLVLGDRTSRAERAALTPVQRFGNVLATRLIERFTGHRYQDMGPFRAIRMESLLLLQMEEPTWGWNVEMQMKAIRRGLRVREVPVSYRARRHGASKISGNVQGAARAGARILVATLRYRTR